MVITRLTNHNRGYLIFKIIPNINIRHYISIYYVNKLKEENERRI